jgi:hypothetical protein
VARFDVFRNPNPRASHGLLLDVQSDLVRTQTRWCVPLLRAEPATPVMSGAQLLLAVAGEAWLLDTPNILAVPALLLRAPVLRLAAADQLQVESALDFMLRGW